jgi:hypothetical protein
MLAFLKSVQLPNGEFPYSLMNANGEGRERIHYECFQYHAFQLQDLAIYYQITNDASVLPMITKIAQFLESGVNADGSTQFDCQEHNVEMPYSTAAIAAALGFARRIGAHDALDAENRAYRFVLSLQHRDGGFHHTKGNYGFLADLRYYPRPLTMLLYHLLLKAQELQTEKVDS